MKQYLDHSRTILSDKRSGYKPNRTGIDTISLFGYQNEYDLQEGFPLMTTKKMPFKTIAHELLWFMRGENNIKYLVDNNVHIWDGNAFQHQLKKQGRDKEVKMYSPQWVTEKEEYIRRIKEDPIFAQEHGDLGPVYGTQWRHWKTSEGKEIDQFGGLIETLRKSPSSRRLIVSAWNPAEVSSMALPPCHLLYHINVQDGNMDLQLYQRSCDMFLGVPFNIVSYALLTQIVAQQAGLKPRRFIHTFGDSHFYCGAGERGAFYGKNLELLKGFMAIAQNPGDHLETLNWISREAPAEEPGKEGQDHVTGILEQLTRVPLQLPKIRVSNKPFEQLTIEDITLEGYNPHPTIKRAMAV